MTLTLCGFVLGLVTLQFGVGRDLPPARVVDAVVDTDDLPSEFPSDGGVATGSPVSILAEGRAFVTASDAGAVGEPAPPITTATTAITTPERAPAGTTTIVATPPSTGEPSARQRGETALTRITYDWRAGLPGWEISFHPGRDGVLGFTFVQERRIEVYVRDSMSDDLLAHVIAHEIGHAIDVTMNSGDDRRRWQAQRAIEDAPWWPGNGATDFSTGAGDFAESFAAWQVGDASFRSNLGAPPDELDQQVLAELSR